MRHENVLCGENSKHFSQHFHEFFFKIYFSHGTQARTYSLHESWAVIVFLHFTWVFIAPLYLFMFMQYHRALGWVENFLIYYFPPAAVVDQQRRAEMKFDRELLTFKCSVSMKTQQRAAAASGALAGHFRLFPRTAVIFLLNLRWISSFRLPIINTLTPNRPSINFSFKSIQIFTLIRG